MQSTEKIEAQLKELCQKGLLTLKTQKNPCLKVSYKGAGGLISTAWNVSIYTSGSISCPDKSLLKMILNDELEPPDPTKTCLQIDDAGVGYPLLGAMVGVTDGSVVKTAVVDVSHFQEPAFLDKSYMREYARQGWLLVSDTFKAGPETHRNEICTGHINNQLKRLLQERGFDVRGVRIEGLLQNNLEDMFRNYVLETLGEDLYYDPKGMSNSQIAREYKSAVRWAYTNGKSHLLKSGWKSLGGGR